MDGCEIFACVVLVIIFCIMVIAMCWCSFGSFEKFENIVSSSNETLKYKMKGGKHYRVLNHDETIVDALRKMEQDGKPGMVAILADFCGHCRTLKDSGVLVDVSKNYPVVTLDENHPQASVLMQKLDFHGFPLIAIFKNRNLTLYKGPRDLRSILSSMQ